MPVPLFRLLLADVLRFGRGRVALTCVLVALGSLLEGVSLILIAPLLTILAGGSGGSSRWLAVAHAFGSTRERQAFALLALFGCAMLARGVLLAWRQVEVATLERLYLAAKQQQLIAALGRASWPSVSRLRHARVTHLLSHDVYRVGQAATGLVEITVGAITLAIQFALALYVEPRLTAVALVLVAGGAAVTLPLMRAARAVGETITGTSLGLLNDAGQFLGALKLAASQNLRERFVADFDAGLTLMAQEEIAYVRAQNMLRLRVGLLGLIVAIGTAWAGIALFGIPVATLIALLAILSRMAQPVNQLQTQLGELVRSLPAFGQLGALRAELEEGAPAAATGDMPAPHGTIAFEAVSFVHGGREGGGGVRGLDLVIPQGALFGIAGASGAGKTTFADLLVGLYAPTSGRIAVGGEAAALDRLPAWRDGLGYVSQDPFLANDTVLANLLWGAAATDDAAMARALAVSGADAVIARLPAGLHTIVGERGGLLSGGERQRIALARALLRQPGLLILDEATNAIDVETEQAILTRLGGLRAEMTIVMIAHRLESLSHCGTIAIFEEGRVVEQGTFAQLKPRLAAVAREG